MELALIPPMYYLVHTWDMKYHLILPHLLENPGYSEYVEDVCRISDEFVILDNGLAENQQIKPVALIAIGTYYGVDEIVVPDVLGKREASVERAVDFMVELDRVREDHDYPNSLAFVAQGETVAETTQCAVDYLDNSATGAHVATIMIPRRLVSPEQPHARLQVAQNLYNAGLGGVNIHLLGASKYFPQELRVAARDYPFIRSLDTSMPYVFAQHGVKVDSGHMPPHRDSSQKYWGWRPPSQYHRDVVSHNVNTMKRWAAGK
jgi:hypothetical protein